MTVSQPLQSLNSGYWLAGCAEVELGVAQHGPGTGAVATEGRQDADHASATGSAEVKGQEIRGQAHLITDRSLGWIHM
ncbi:MAG: hypothetical protein A2X82_12455 [Geobacteraceae bacterium GWC2_55_20]|nr:MAG: hypothetical protein A2X82_12455 [Geobacteraceae bacterium GWC2_55_20]OGU19482.1 MAG: hypothetical protein A2X85_02155 [Geobacteraceae bacterium GWF2_54_21]HBA71007.1 hypothetical protein [Geobacter sp.]HCE67695.1 hypothetical protein [Geobacter sp.]